MKTASASRRRLALTAALLGWLFDGLEIGLFPLVARPALRDLLPGQSEAVIGLWFGLITAGFLVGAAAGGVLLGRLGDRLGRVQAMTLSILLYAGCSGLGGFAQSPEQLWLLRFLAALGMGGEWALGVALVMELYPASSRGWLAAAIGAAGNLGYGLVALIYFGIHRLPMLEGAGTANWRYLMFAGAVPALLVFFIRLFVPESPRWQVEQTGGRTAQWSRWDLGWILLGTVISIGMIALWMRPRPGWLAVAGCVVAVPSTAMAFLQPTRGYLRRRGVPAGPRRRLLARMVLGAGLSGVPLLSTWAGVMWQYNFVDQLTGGTNPDARPTLMLASSLGAALGSAALPLLGLRYGARRLYAWACVLSAGMLYGFFSLNQAFNTQLVLSSFALGALCASFYGWIALYLPALYPTALRATAQGFAYNFGRILAAVGALQMTTILNYFNHDYARACSISAGIFVVGLILIALAPSIEPAAELEDEFRPITD